MTFDEFMSGFLPAALTLQHRNGSHMTVSLTPSAKTHAFAEWLYTSWSLYLVSQHWVYVRKGYWNIQTHYINT